MARNTNLPPDQAALTELERAQLIALLETTLVLLKSPLVEKGLLKKTVEAAKQTATNAAKKQSDVALGFALSKIGHGLQSSLASCN